MHTTSSPNGKVFIVSESILNLVPRDDDLEDIKIKISTDNGYSSNEFYQNYNSKARCQANEISVAAEEKDQEKEQLLALVLQVFIPFLIAGFGMVGAGLMLDYIQNWPVFTNISEIFIMVPPLMGLKGNLEMTRASRLSTLANMGLMDSKTMCIKIIMGNVAVTQCQATVVGIIAALVAILIGLIPGTPFVLNNAIMTCVVSVITAFTTTLILGFVMILVIMLCRYWRANPDNIAIPVAASLGDMITLAALAFTATFFYGYVDDMKILGTCILLGFILLIPAFALVSYNNQYTRDTLLSGWTPVISAILISSAGGLLLDQSVSKFEKLALFQPAINGVGGNLVSVQASRISTFLHQHVPLGQLPKLHQKIFVLPWKTFKGQGNHASMARILMAMVIPGHLIFSYLLCYLKTGQANMTMPFLGMYLTVSVLQVALLLYMALLLVYFVWKRRTDPDNATIPYLTAMGDLLGIVLLTAGFYFLSLFDLHDNVLGTND